MWGRYSDTRAPQVVATNVSGLDARYTWAQAASHGRGDQHLQWLFLFLTSPGRYYPQIRSCEYM